jgi:triosephosphate isomerase
MNKVVIVGNLKSYEDINEAGIWISSFISQKQVLENLGDKEVIICPTFTLLSEFKSSFENMSIKIGVQNISPFDEGAYTGEVNAKQIKNFAQYAIIGHSERRNYFHEMDDTLSEKVKMAIKYQLSPIYCVQDKGTFIPEGVKMIAYEPVFAIGSGNPDTPENADAIAASIKSGKNDRQVLYGGSVTSQNIKSFTSKTHLDGVLVGSASLDPVEFINIIQNA